MYQFELISFNRRTPGRGAAWLGRAPPLVHPVHPQAAPPHCEHRQPHQLLPLAHSRLLHRGVAHLRAWA
jgi:hypothetical protein